METTSTRKTQRYADLLTGQVSEDGVQVVQGHGDQVVGVVAHQNLQL